jgi:hypothetical protein
VRPLLRLNARRQNDAMVSRSNSKFDRFGDYSQYCRSGFGRNLDISVPSGTTYANLANILLSTNVFSLDTNSSFSICKYDVVVCLRHDDVSIYFALLQDAQYKIYVRGKNKKVSKIRHP